MSNLWSTGAVLPGRSTGGRSDYGMDNIITAEDLRKYYTNGQKEVRAVDGVSLEIKKARATAIVGPSGAGKATLLHLLGGLDIPTSGTVSFGGADLYKLSDSQRAALRNRKIGFVFQFYHLLPEFSALENVMLPGLIKGQGSRVKGQGIKEKARDVLKAV